ncbi:glycosyl hydrolase 108 family protein [Hoeflea poritis]|uniref:TtsA-like Glycoside hydrolase family 108 domain-containing protein n=1 Tax=Hoeflea poritis TaxID=2993659 RepID=A0ABT4VUT7_9HYPH|nr:glycosyl hydrolase 108 family protein [Hoeflea poritis]MDA4848473.1 hypothetical protein [Hoeflea poritis]
MSRFNEIMETVFRWEGGYVDHPDDPGGATNMGITHKVLAKWRGVPAVSKKEVRNLTREEAEEIFRSRYYDVIKGRKLPEPIDLIVMDGAVNHGTKTMVQFLEEALGVEQNGKLGNNDINTLKEATGNEDDLIALAVSLADARKQRYLTRPHAVRFIKGWTNRLNDVMAVALRDRRGTWTFAHGYDAEGMPGTSLDPDPVSSVIRPVIEDDELQAALVTWGDYTGEIDGLFGPMSLAAADRALQRNSAIVSGNWHTWSNARKKIAIGQLVCRDLGIDVGRIDGLFGPLTEAAFVAFNRILRNMPPDKWRDELERGGDTPAFEPVLTEMNTWPRRDELVNFFGKECTPNDHSEGCGRGTVKLKRLELPFPMRIAWDLNTTISGFSIHEMVHDSAARVLDKVYQHYDDDGVEELGINLFGGCYNCRKIRGGSRCSTHAWGIAIDFDPARNRLKWDHRLARLAKPDAVKFWELWEAEGWVSLGRARDYDWMHVQAARL